MKKIEEQNASSTDTETSSEDTRRAALAKMGLYAAYTAPAMLAMMTSAKAQVASGCIPSTSGANNCVSG